MRLYDAGAAAPVRESAGVPVDYRFGPRVHAGGTTFRLWAPAAEAVDLLMDDGRHAMAALPDGWFERTVPVGPGTRYAFGIGDRTVPDPASRRQDGGVDGWSIVTPPSLATGHRRLGRPWSEMVIAEVHVGTATPEGTFRALAEKLPHFAAAGYTAIELMPIAAFPGERGWGYDGVLPFAPHPPYGSPQDLAALVEAAHRLGLAVLLDAVHNHFGPLGNQLPSYAPVFFDTATHTPWGPAIDLTREEVRRYFIESALWWAEAYGVDGLRFDAVHALQGAGRERFLAELASTLNALQPRPHLLLENEHNEARRLQGALESDPERYTAQWNDDFHHVFHVAVTGETEGYYAAYADAPLERAARVLAEGFDYQGEPILIRKGHPRGEPSGHLHPTAFVSFLQNHDQIGNRAHGDRLTALAPLAAVRLLRFLTLLSPQVPMLFMGEEYEELRPFLFFCDYEGEMGEAVRNGRRAEFAAFTAFTGDLPDPIAPSTRDASRLDWARAETPEGRAALEATAAYAALRRQVVEPLLGSAFVGAETSGRHGLLVARWDFAAGSYGLVANFGRMAQFAQAPASSAVATVGGVTEGDDWLLDSFSGALWIPS